MADTWNSSTGFWSTATDWSDGQVPNGGPVQITSGDTVTITGGTLGEAGGTITNSGTISIDAVFPGQAVYASGLGIVGATVLNGGGKIVLSASGQYNSNFLMGTGGAGSSLENVDNTISGAGIIGDNADYQSTGLNIIQNDAAGVIEGTGTTVALLIEGNTGNGVQSMTLTNNGLIEANSSNAYSQALELDSVILNQSGGGVLLAQDGDVRLSNTTVIGGTLETTGTNLIEIFSDANGTATLDGSGSHPVTITTGSTVDAGNGGKLILDGSIVNQGTIAVDPANYPTVLSIGTTGAPTATLSGGGKITLASSISFIDANVAGAVLDNVNNTISGAGTIGINGEDFDHLDFDERIRRRHRRDQHSDGAHHHRHKSQQSRHA